MILAFVTRPIWPKSEAINSSVTFGSKLPTYLNFIYDISPTRFHKFSSNIAGANIVKEEWFLNLLFDKNKISSYWDQTLYLKINFAVLAYTETLIHFNTYTNFIIFILLNNFWYFKSFIHYFCFSLDNNNFLIETKIGHKNSTSKSAFHKKITSNSCLSCFIAKNEQKILIFSKKTLTIF